MVFKRLISPFFFASRSLAMAESAAGPNGDWKHAKSIYEFTANDIDGHPVSMEKYKCVLTIRELISKYLIKFIFII